MDKKPSSRLTQYLDFVKLYTDVHKESNAKKEANIIWKQKIQSTSNDELSTMDYLEQLALLKTKKNIQASRPCGHAPDPDISLDLEIPIEFSCEGASKSVEIAGTFNNWQPEPLKYNSKEGDWVATLNLTPGLLCKIAIFKTLHPSSLDSDLICLFYLGVHYYKYVVDGEWIHNPNKEWEEDEEGNVNNVMRLEDSVSRSLREMAEERERLAKFLEEPWQVDNHRFNYCTRI